MQARFKVGESYGALAQFRYPKIFVEGPRGTAKSRSILSFLLAKLHEFPGSRLLLCRRYRSDLTKTILMTLEQEVFPSFGIPVPGGAHRSNRSEYTLPNGSMIWPAGIDDGMGILSMGITFAYVAECIEMTEEMVTDIAGGLRWLKSPEQPTLPDYSQMILDANPGPPGHWVNRIAEEVDNKLRYVRSVTDYFRLQEHNYKPAADPVHRWKRIITKHQDNPGYWNFDKWDYTSLGRNYVTLQLEGLTGHKRARWLNGLWKSAEGSVYPEFDEDRNSCPPFPKGWPAHWPVYVAYDSGYDHPAAVIFMGVAPTGQLFIIDEIHESGLALDELGRKIVAKAENLKVVKWLADPRDCFKHTAHASGKTIAQHMRENFKLHFQPWPMASGPEVHNQVEHVRNQIRKPKDPLMVWKNCSMTIFEFQSWAYRRMADGTLPAGDDAFEDRNNDAMDAVRGLIASNVQFHQYTATSERRGG